jgi:uncharacterized protein (UPF0261 family)
MATVVLLGTLDTKEREYRFVRECLLEAGVTPLVIDFGVLADPSIKPDISASEVAEAGGKQLKDLRSAREGTNTRASSLAVMTAGLIVILRRLLQEGRCDAVFGLGGSGGSSVISAAMRSLPLGLPKFLVSTMASGNVGGYVGTKDLAILYSVTDIAGLNRVSRPILRNAALGIAGMAKGGAVDENTNKPLVAVTMFGITTPCGLRIVERLESAGFETVVFHANGSGRAMEELIDERIIDGVVDMTTKELTDATFGGAFGAGPNRMEAASRKGIPQVIIPGGLEVCNFGPRNTVPEKFDTPERKIIIHNPFVCAARINLEESKQIGKLFATKANATTGPTAVVIPLNGLDKYQEPPDGPWIDKEKDHALFQAIRSTLRKDILLQELDLYINDPKFSDAAVNTFIQLWEHYLREKGKL